MAINKQWLGITVLIGCAASVAASPAEHEAIVLLPDVPAAGPVADPAAPPSESQEPSQDEALGEAERLEELYQRGTEMLDREQWDAAVESFETVARAKGKKSDAALYWKAYALYKRNRRADALATVDRLKQEHPQSRWLKEAQALELEIRQRGGEKPSPDALADDDLKLIALNGLMNSDESEALPLIEKMVMGGASPKVREQALVILTQSDSPKARQILARVARGDGGPLLEHKAVEFLGMMDDPETRVLLLDIYAKSKEPEVRRAVLHSLGMMNARTELLGLYRTETDRPLKEEILNGLWMAEDASTLIKIAREEKERTLKRKAVEMLSMMDAPEAHQFMRELLDK